MKNNQLKLPIFPLSVFMLPEGLTRLRIIEARDLSIIKIAAKQSGFIIVLNDDRLTAEDNELQWGSWVEIVNFDQGHDQVLEIDVKCKSLVNITSISPESEALCLATFEPIPHWSQDLKTPSIKALSTSLMQVFKNNQLLNQLYVNKPMGNANWVVARWLELLPVANKVKSTFIHHYNAQAATNFVQAIIIKP